MKLLTRYNNSFMSTFLVRQCQRSSASTSLMIKVTKNITIRNNDESQKSPVVFIYGWGNGKLSNLQKYSEIFERRNFTTVLITTSLINSLFRVSTAGKQDSEKVENVFHQLCEKNNDREIIFYSFSNGGCAISHLVAHSLSASLSIQKIKGHIFDSCPIIPNEESAVAVEKAFQGLIKSPVIQPLIKVLSKLMVYIVVNLNKDVKMFIPQMIESPISSPQLFLFSKDDELAPYKDILEFIKQRKQRNIDVQYELWETSQHCAHFKNHAQRYEQLVTEFVTHCLHVKH